MTIDEKIADKKAHDNIDREAKKYQRYHQINWLIAASYR